MPVREATYLLLGLLATGLPSLRAQEFNSSHRGIVRYADDSETRFTASVSPPSRLVAVETLTVAERSSAIADVGEFGVRDAEAASGFGMHQDAESSELNEPPLPLPPRTKSGGSSDAQGPSAGRSPIWTVASSLTMVVGLFLLTIWGARRHLPQAVTPLPDDVVRVLGRAPLAHRQTMQLVRVGHKLVLLCVTPQGAETLAEIHDPDEVERLTASCDPTCSDAMSATLRQVLAQVDDPRYPVTRSEAASGTWNPYVRKLRS